MKITNFRDLEVWKLGMEILLDVYNISKTLPRDEIYGLSSQMKRAAVSIPSNISEGFNRFHNKEYRQFLYVALGSCAELETQVEAGHLLKFFDDEIRRNILDKLDHESRMLRNLIKKL